MPRHVERQQGVLLVAVALGGTSVLAFASLPGDVCSVAAVVSFLCPDHTLNSRDARSCQSSSLSLSPGGLSFSLQISAKLVG